MSPELVLRIICYKWFCQQFEWLFDLERNCCI